MLFLDNLLLEAAEVVESLKAAKKPNWKTSAQVAS